MIKKWWFWVAIMIAGIMVWQFLSGWAMSSKLYNMALNNLRTDQTKVIRTLEQIITQREAELSDLYKKVGAVQKQSTVAQAESERLRKLVNEKNAEIAKLQREREVVVVPVDPDMLVDEFRKRGYRPRIILPPK